MSKEKVWSVEDTWRVIFCAECRKPYKPHELTDYNGNYLCNECDCTEVLSQQPKNFTHQYSVQ